MPQLFSNNSKGTVAAAGITAVATSLPLTTGHGARFPALTGSDWFLMTLYDGTNIEVVKVTARVTDTLTIVRAVEGIQGAASGTAYAFAGGTKAEMRLTDGSFTRREELGFTIVATNPTAPAAGRGNLILREYAKRVMALVDSGNTLNPTRLQPSLITNSFLLYKPSTGAALGMVMGYGAYAQPATSVGTLTTPVIADTNRQTRMRRTLFTTPVATAGSTITWNPTAADFFCSRNSGFFFHCRFAIITPAAGARLLIGLRSGTGVVVPFTTGEPTAVAESLVGIITIAADTVLKFGARDGTTFNANATTGPASSKTVNTPNTWDLFMYCPPGGASVFWRLEDVHPATPTVVEGTQTTNLPALATLLRPTFSFGNGTTAASAAIALVSLYLETDL